MAFSSVTKKGISESTHSFTSTKNPFIPPSVKFLNLKAGNSYKLRVLPNNSNIEKYGKEYNSFAVPIPQHYGVGMNKKETLWCPQQIAPRLKIHCPLCEEFSVMGTKSERACSKPYYYMNVVLLSKIEGVPNYKEDGKTLIVYTVKVPKKSVFDVISDYYDDTERAVPDLVDLAKGCAITIKMTDQTIEGRDGKPKKVPNYNTQINEAATGSLVKSIAEADCHDLRDLCEFVPTELAIKEAMEGMPINEAVTLCGKVSTITGEQIGGAKDAPATTADEAPDTTGIDADGEVEIVEE